MTHENAFKHLDNTDVVLNVNGVFVIRGLCQRTSDDRVYAEFGNGYVKLMANGFTSKRGVSWDNLNAGDLVRQDRLKGPLWA